MHEASIINIHHTKPIAAILAPADEGKGQIFLFSSIFSFEIRNGRYQTQPAPAAAFIVLILIARRVATHAFPACSPNPANGMGKRQLQTTANA